MWRASFGWLVLAAAAAVLLPAAVRAVEPTERVTASVERGQVAALLRRVAGVYDGGFGRGDAARVAAEIDALPANAERTWDFSTSYAKNPSALRIRVRVDDLSMADFDFNTTPGAAAELRRAMDARR